MVRVSCRDGNNKKTWRLSTYEDLKRRLQGLGPQQVYEDIDAVDVLTIGCRSDPVPACEVNDHAAFSSIGYYAGGLSMTEALRDDLITVPIVSDRGQNIGMHKVCRWVMFR